MDEATKPTLATFTPQSANGSGASKSVTVHFNPASLQISMTNTLEEKGGKGKGKKTQCITKSSVKLTMDLIFDTTHTLSDVRAETRAIAKLMDPLEQGSGKDKNHAQVVLFEWGAYKFKGIVESYKETIDFFSPTGIPLRSSINLSLTNQEEVFYPVADAQGAAQDKTVEVARTDGGASQIANRAGAPGAARAIAASNNQESLRFPSGPVTVDASIQLAPPVAFASASVDVGVSGGIGGGGIGFEAGLGAGLDIEGGFGASIEGGFGASIEGGFGVSADVGISGSVEVGAELTFGGSASAGISASAGAFAGLRTKRQSRSFNTLDTNRLILFDDSLTFSASADASFDVGGQAVLEGDAEISLGID